MPQQLSDWLRRLEARHPVAVDLGLERCGRVWRRLGSPRPGKRAVTVAGTNGKGSTVAWLAALFAATGRSTVVYTSPHLLAFNERLCFDGEAVTDGQLVAAFESVEAARGNESLTYFEFTTLACFVLAAQRAPDWAVLEVGLGGRLDTVNLVDADLAVITPVGLDHQEYLGADREAIGVEKAGVLRAGIPLVCGEAEPPTSVIRQAERLQCDVYLPGRDYALAPDGRGVRFSMNGRTLNLPVPGLGGVHQHANLGAALAAASLGEPSLWDHAGAVATAVSGLRLPGRLYRPPGQERLVLDVGHNPMAASAVADWLRGQGPVDCVLGMLADKDAEGVATVLAPRVRRWYCAGIEGPRGQGGEQLAARVGAALPDAVIQSRPTVTEALEAAQKAADGGTVLVFGSFRTVSEALACLERRTP